MSGLGGLSWNWISPILAFSILVGPPALFNTCWFSTKPSTISLSSIVPPDFFTILMLFRSTLSAVFGSITRRTESTAIGPILGSWETIFDERDVVAAFRRVGRSDSLMGIDMS